MIRGRSTIRIAPPLPSGTGGKSQPPSPWLADSPPNLDQGWKSQPVGDPFSERRNFTQQ
jgi:hypothetical protein